MTPNDTTSTETFHEATALDYQQLYNEQREQNAQLQGVIAATRSQAVASSPTFNQKAAITSDRFKATVGPVAFLNMTREQKLRGLGVDPASISDEGLRALFGRGNSGTLAQDLMKSNPFKYRTLKECALILNIFGG